MNRPEQGLTPAVRGLFAVTVVGMLAFLALAAAGTTVVDRASLVVLALTMACMTLVGLIARKGASDH